ncbi:MAG TPA: cytidylate kinase-like family protein [Oscillospiraceae bacterium]|nr:cytidylate kinase-like family protein [Oscillospiraceae bacterium]HPF56394.1 cytidylate kinase-like family protein [Clostridiales bacterium]HPK35100.1 cytidylate kinase-like family protein [Oscillospiraceae bacterium]HPR75251.1 cytidylate kinase-like family protein [Oscillospiraceae bacterium]
MSKQIITISREFGSGGRSIAKALAENLGIKYYDKELVKQVSLETGFAQNFIEEHGEYAQSKSKFESFFGQTGTPGVMNGLSADDFLWCIQRDVIQQIAEKEPCVIVGRCADYILKDRSDCLHVFIHADMAYRAERIVRLYGQSENTPEKRISDKDARRSVYYKQFTGRDWGMAQNYHITLNSGVIGIDKCVAILEDLYKQ